MSTERGIAIQEAVRAMGQEKYLRQLAQQRDRRMAQKRAKQKKEADATAIAATSSDVDNKNTLNNYTIGEEKCQPSQSALPTALPRGEPDCGVDGEGEVADSAFDERDTPGDTSDGEIRQQGCSELPMHLL